MGKKSASILPPAGIALIAVGILLILFWVDAPLKKGSHVVKAGGTLELSWYLEERDRTEGGFTVSGGNGNASLSIKNPSGEIIRKWYATNGTYAGGFTAQDTGMYTMVFENLDLANDQSIYVGYRSPYEPRITVYDCVGMLIVALGSIMILFFIMLFFRKA